MTLELYANMPYQWLCCTCKHALHSSSKNVHVSKYSQHRSELLSIAMKQIDDSILKNILELYKQSLQHLMLMCMVCEKNVMCRRWIISTLKDKFGGFSPKGSKFKYSLFLTPLLYKGEE